MSVNSVYMDVIYKCDSCHKTIKTDNEMLKLLYKYNTSGSYRSMFRTLQFHRDCFRKLYIFRDSKYPSNSVCKICGRSIYDGRYVPIVEILWGYMGIYFMEISNSEKNHLKCFNKFFNYEVKDNITHYEQV